MDHSFEDAFSTLFPCEFPRVFGLLVRSCGDAELANDLAQETFVRLYRRGSLPDSTAAWLATVALNLLRNARSRDARRAELLTVARGAGVHSEAAPSVAEGLASEEARRRVRDALDGLAERERNLLLLRSEGYSYREIAEALDLNERSVGTLLARARKAFRTAYSEVAHAR